MLFIMTISWQSPCRLLLECPLFTLLLSTFQTLCFRVKLACQVLQAMMEKR